MAKAKEAELVPAGNTALTTGEDVPEFLQQYVGQTTGAEGLTRDDIRMPRLAIAQAMSPQKLDGNPAFIEGLKLGEMFNTLTSQVYGKGPLEFVIVRRDPPRWVEFDDDRNMIDPNVPHNDPRTAWRAGQNGERLAPIATQFYDYIVALYPSLEPIAISLARTGIGAAKTLNGLIQMRIPPVPLYARRFRVETATKTNDKGTFGIYVFKNAGSPGVPNSDLVREKAQFEFLKGMHESMQDVVFEIDRDANEGDTSFDTSKMEKQEPNM
jgi:hypothetical protein